MDQIVTRKKPDEPLLASNPFRFTFFPIQQPAVYEMYQTAQASFWTSSEVDLGEDLRHWVKLSDGEQHFITHVLAFFAASDGIVGENLVENFCKEVQLPEARAFYGFQLAIEQVHSEVYSQLIDHYVQDPAEKLRLFRGIQTIPTVTKKAAFAQKWMNAKLPFNQRVVAFAAVEGIQFSGSFCAIFWLKKRGILPGLTFSNELISRDEGLHMQFAVLMHSLLVTKCPEDIGRQIIKDAVDIEIEFICEALPVSLIGMNSDLMRQYVQFTADYLMRLFGWANIYNTTNPFDWMELISLQGKTNFFERRVGDYAKAGVKGDREKNSNHKFSLEEEF